MESNHVYPTPPTFFYEFLPMAETLFVISIVFLITGILIHISLSSIRKDYGEITRAPLWKKVPGIIGGLLFSIFVLIFIVSRSGNLWVALTCGFITAGLIIIGLIIQYITNRNNKNNTTAESDESTTTAKSDDKASSQKSENKKLFENEVIVYILNSLSIIAKHTYIVYTIVSISFNLFTIHIQRQNYYYASLAETLRLWDILITAVSAIAVVVFFMRLCIELTNHKKEETGNYYVRLIKKRLIQ